LSESRVVDEEVRGADQRRYRLRIGPYKTIDDAIRGAVLTLFDINDV
jgi:hypothetical protein